MIINCWLSKNKINIGDTVYLRDEVKPMKVFKFSIVKLRNKIHQLALCEWLEGKVKKKNYYFLKSLNKPIFSNWEKVKKKRSVW